MHEIQVMPKELHLSKHLTKYQQLFSIMISSRQKKNNYHNPVKTILEIISYQLHSICIHKFLKSNSKSFFLIIFRSIYKIQVTFSPSAVGAVTSLGSTAHLSIFNYLFYFSPRKISLRHIYIYKKYHTKRSLCTPYLHFRHCTSPVESPHDLKSPKGIRLQTTITLHCNCLPWCLTEDRTFYL